MKHRNSSREMIFLTLMQLGMYFEKNKFVLIEHWLTLHKLANTDKIMKIENVVYKVFMSDTD